MTTIRYFRNVTIDDDDKPNNNSALTFKFDPSDCGGIGWKVITGKGYLGSYKSCTLGEDAAEVPSAVVEFTGVAVYYSSPILNGESIRVSLDGMFSDEIDLSGLADGESDSSSAQARIVYQQANLSDGIHILRIFPGDKSKRLSVDAVIVTQLSSTTRNEMQIVARSSTSVSSSPSNNGTILTSSSTIEPGTITGLSPTALSQTTSSESPDKFAISFGSVFGGITFLILVLLFVIFGRRRRDLKQNYGVRKGAEPIPPIHSLRDGRMTTNSRLETQVSGVGTAPMGSPQSSHGTYPPIKYVTQNNMEMGREKTMNTEMLDFERERIEKATPPPPTLKLPDVAYGSSTMHNDFERLGDGEFGRANDRNRDNTESFSVSEQRNFVVNGVGNASKQSAGSSSSILQSSPGTPASQQLPLYVRSAKLRDTTSTTATSSSKLVPVRRGPLPVPPPPPY